MDSEEMDADEEAFAISMEGIGNWLRDEFKRTDGKTIQAVERYSLGVCHEYLKRRPEFRHVL